MRSSILCLLLISVVGFSFGQSGSSECNQTSNLIQLIEKNHVQPLALNDEWSTRVFKNFFNELDPIHLFFTQDDIITFLPQQYQLDDFVKTGKPCDWVNPAAQLLKKRLNDYRLWLTQSLGRPFDYTQKDKFDIARFPSADSFESKNGLEMHRRSYIKFLILMRMYVSSVADSSGNSLIQYESVSRKNILKKELKKIEDIESRGIEAYAGNCFLNAIALAYDPHTAYMSISEKEDFDESLSDENLSFGFSLEEDQTGSFTVINIVPGGSAWNSNAVREGDLLLSITTGDREINAMDYELEDFQYELARATSEVLFNFRRPDGQLTKIKLVKTKVRSVENTVSGYVLRDSKKIGYIPLPSFYFDRSHASGGAAGDVAKAIIKLNKEGIEGLILDLRSNGGGSVDEARDLAGIFIDFGPVIMGKASDQTVSVLKDTNKGSIYSGPLIIMVNSFSASASELLASALQDYNRAIIVGGKTYGKATGQNIYPLPGSTTDFAKITTLKLYRINGKTYQHRGVVPDIELPDATQSLGEREADLPFALPSDSVTKKTYYTPVARKSLALVAEKSKKRVSGSPEFNDVEKTRLQLLNPISLDLTGFTQEMKRSKISRTNSSSFTVTSTAFDSSLLAFDAFQRAMNEKSVREIRESFYIQEAYNIMLDYISQK